MLLQTVYKNKSVKKSKSEIKVCQNECECNTNNVQFLINQFECLSDNNVKNVSAKYDVDKCGVLNKSPSMKGVNNVKDTVSLDLAILDQFLKIDAQKKMEPKNKNSPYANSMSLPRAREKPQHPSNDKKSVDEERSDNLKTRTLSSVKKSEPSSRSFSRNFFRSFSTTGSKDKKMKQKTLSISSVQDNENQRTAIPKHSRDKENGRYNVKSRIENFQNQIAEVQSTTGTVKKQSQNNQTYNRSTSNEKKQKLSNSKVENKKDDLKKTKRLQNNGTTNNEVRKPSINDEKYNFQSEVTVRKPQEKQINDPQYRKRTNSYIMATQTDIDLHKLQLPPEPDESTRMSYVLRTVSKFEEDMKKNHEPILTVVDLQKQPEKSELKETINNILQQFSENRRHGILEKDHRKTLSFEIDKALLKSIRSPSVESQTKIEETNTDVTQSTEEDVTENMVNACTDVSSSKQEIHTPTSISEARKSFFEELRCSSDKTEECITLVYHTDEETEKVEIAETASSKSSGSYTPDPYIKPDYLIIMCDNLTKNNLDAQNAAFENPQNSNSDTHRERASDIAEKHENNQEQNIHTCQNEQIHKNIYQNIVETNNELIYENVCNLTLENFKGGSDCSDNDPIFANISDLNNSMKCEDNKNDEKPIRRQSRLYSARFKRHSIQDPNNNETEKSTTHNDVSKQVEQMPEIINNVPNKDLIFCDPDDNEQPPCVETYNSTISKQYYMTEWVESVHKHISSKENQNELTNEEYPTEYADLHSPSNQQVQLHEEANYLVNEDGLRSWTLVDEQNHPMIRVQSTYDLSNIDISEQTNTLRSNGSSSDGFKIEESEKEFRKNIDGIKNASYKDNLILELISTEKSYTNKSLRRLVRDYMPVMEKPDLPNGLAGKLRNIFGNVDFIYECHKNKFLPDLEAHTNIDDLANCFLNHENIFKLYALYSKNKPKSDMVMRDYGTYFKEKQAELKDRLDLASYLLTPIQRLGKYCLLVKSIVRECEKDGTDVEKLRKALEMLQNQMRIGNDLIAIDSICNCNLSIKEQGDLLLRDVFFVTPPNKKPAFQAMVFLFQESLLITRIDRHNGGETFSYYDNFKLTDMGITDNESEPMSFMVWFRRHNQKNYTLRANTSSLRKKWTEEIFNLLWKQLEANKKIQKKEQNQCGMKEIKIPLDTRPYSIPNSKRNISISTPVTKTRSETTWYFDQH